MATGDERKGWGRLLEVAGVVLIVAVLSVSVAWYYRGGEDEEEKDFTGWYLAMSMRRFVNTAQRPINVTELLFTVTLGELQRNDWVVQESDGFFVGEGERWFPLRLEARYDNGKDPVEDFAILGSAHEVSGSVQLRNDGIKVKLDGEADLITIDNSIDDYPHPYERTARLEGDNGVLTLYFNLNKPT